MDRGYELTRLQIALEHPQHERLDRHAAVSVGAARNGRRAQRREGRKPVRRGIGMHEVRKIKTQDEITLLNTATMMVDAAYDELYRFMRPKRTRKSEWPRTPTLTSRS